MFWFLSSSICRIIFSTKTTPISIIIPIAIAIPDRATMFASILRYRIRIKVESTAIGKILEIIIEALRLNINTITTIMLMRISKVRAVSSVPMVSFINPDLS